MRRLTFLGMCVTLGMLVVGATMLVSSRDDVLREAEHASANLALALERDISRNLATFDLSLQGAIDALALPGLEQASDDIKQTALFDRSATAEYLGSILVLDSGGRITASSVPAGEQSQSLRLDDRDYFQAHKQRADAGLFLSRPYSSRLRKGDASIAISRRIPRPDGSFGGVVMGALRLAYFQHLFDPLELGPGAMVSLVRTDGIMVARRPAVAGDAGMDVSGSPDFRRMVGEGSGSFTAQSKIDGVERLLAFRRIGDLPLVLTVGLALDDVYSAWWRKAAVIGLVLLLLSVATAALCLLFRREMLLRLVAEAELQEAAAQLRRAAATDSLTGIANRRAFEAELHQEWRRAARAGTPLSLLMLDADQFKPYNDLYGHPAGDAALRRIAEVIQSELRRQGDFAARIGGEEFVVLLPNTPRDGALAIAERIRKSLHAAEILHAGSPGGRMTCSIGAATEHPQTEAEGGQLATRADAAMYEAKRQGRDRIVAARDRPIGVTLGLGAPDAALTP